MLLSFTHSDMKFVIVVALIGYGMVRLVKGETLPCPPMPVTCICDGKPQYMTMATSPVRNEEYTEIVCTTEENTVANPFEICDEHQCEFYDSEMDFPPDFSQTTNGTKRYPIGYVIPNVAATTLKTYPVRGMHFELSHRNYKSATDPPKRCRMKPLNNANVFCWNWNYFVSCNVTCLPGYGIVVGNRTLTSWNRKCIATENFWYPSLKQCELLKRKCHVNLIAPGKIECRITPEGHHYCDIQCYADISHPKGNVSLARYPCTDNYANELPWCAVSTDVIDDHNETDNYSTTEDDSSHYDYYSATGDDDDYSSDADDYYDEWEL